MILGVSHIVLASTNLDRDRHFFEGLGWTTRFEQRGIPTHSGKHPFMHTQSLEQGLVFLDPPQGTPVELIHYADELPDTSPSPMQIVLPASGDVETLPRMKVEVPCSAAFAVQAPGITCPLWFANQAPSPSLLVHQVIDLEAATRFWQSGLGFKPSPGSMIGTASLELRSPFKQWSATVLLQQHSGDPCPSFLDAAGYRCLSVVCSDIARSREALLLAGGRRTTGTMALEVNGKQLELEMVEGPDGLLVEILRPPG